MTIKEVFYWIIVLVLAILWTSSVAYVAYLRVAELEKDRAIADALPHPWYGPCDGFGDGETCKECEEVRAHCLEHNFHHITDAQIDAAWRYANASKNATAAFASELALKELGIERCTRCGGRGTSLDIVDGYNALTERVTCPVCNGKGWIKT